MKLFFISIVVFLFCFYSIPLSAQETTGNIEGMLRTDAGEPIAFANVVVSGPGLQGSRGIMSTSDGYFGIFKLPVGVYTVIISHVSYQEVTFENIIIRLGRTTTLGSIALVSKVYETSAIVVKETPKLIDPNSTIVGANISSEEFKELPLDRDYQEMASLLPHANTSFFGDGINFAGSPGQETKYFVDGVETTDSREGRGGTILPYNFLQEIQVRSGGYEAEYRSSLGGIVNAISRTGSNEFHSQVFGFYVNNQFTGDSRISFSDPPSGDFSHYDIGVSFEGPVKHDKLWFFAAYNPKFSYEDVDIPGIGFDRDKGITHVFAGKLTWKAAERTDVNLSITGDPGTREAVESFPGVLALANPDPVLADITTGGVNIVLKGTHFHSDRLFFESSLSRVTRKNKQEARTARGREEIAFLNQETGIASGGYPLPSDAYTEQITADFKATFTMGRHMFKTGIGYRDNQLDYSQNGGYLARVNENMYIDFMFTNEPRTLRNRIPSLFLQDSWRVTDRLRINAGMRWEGQYLVGSNGEVAQKITDQYQPRFGFVYQPGESGTQKVFGTAGRFYHETYMELVNRAFNDGYLLRWTLYDHDPRIDPTGGIVILEDGGEFQDEIDGLEGQHYDEITLGYERQIGRTFIVGARGIYRTLRMGIEDAYVTLPDDSEELMFGNPGEELMSAYPNMKREYTALELTWQLIGGQRYNARASYVLSRNYGNYQGIIGLPNGSGEFDILEKMKYAEGKLENDRTHALKLSGAYRIGYGLTVGTSMYWQSGTPLSVLEGASVEGMVKHAQERGSAGRTPSIWDVNIRIVYDLATVFTTHASSRMILDFLHLGSQREAVHYDQVRNYSADGADPNPTFGLPTRFQPPMAVRLGVELDY